jgi:hypothetical protein
MNYENKQEHFTRLYTKMLTYMNEIDHSIVIMSLLRPVYYLDNDNDDEFISNIHTDVYTIFADICTYNFRHVIAWYIGGPM